MRSICAKPKMDMCLAQPEEVMSVVLPSSWEVVSGTILSMSHSYYMQSRRRLRYQQMSAIVRFNLQDEDPGVSSETYPKYHLDLSP